MPGTGNPLSSVFHRACAQSVAIPEIVVANVYCMALTHKSSENKREVPHLRHPLQIYQIAVSVAVRFTISYVNRPFEAFRH